MSNTAADRNLLFGILAVQMDFISRDQLIAGMQAWVLDKSKPLDEILVDRELLSAADRDLLLPLMQRHILQHDGSPTVSLQVLSSITPSVRVLEELDDPDVTASLAPLQFSRQMPSTANDPVTVSFDVQRSFEGARYQILRPHAKGGLGEVFVARDSELNREVALKEIQEHHAHDSNSRSRFLMEGEITGKLEHPGIVPVYGLGAYDDGRPFYAMRFIQGDTLHKAIRDYHKSRSNNSPPLENDVAFRKLLGRFVDICEAVGYAHSRGVLHRDLKPGNVMLGKHGETLVVDWGLAKVQGVDDPVSEDHTSLPQITSGSGTDQTLPGSATGTPGYMSPEQANGQIEKLGPATDIYSLGCILYTLLTGEVPVRESQFGELLRRVCAGDFPKPREKNPAIPKPLEAICLKAMATERTQRYQSCSELADDIEKFLADEPVTAYREPFVARARRWSRQHRTLVTSTTVAAAMLLMGLAIGLATVASLNSRLDASNDKLQDSNRELNETNEELAVAVQNEQQARTAADASATRAREKQQLAELAEQKAQKQTRLAEQRLLQANEVASEIVFTIDQKLRPVGGAGPVRKELLDHAGKLLESLLIEARDDPNTLRMHAAQLNARGDIARNYQTLAAARALYQQALDIRKKIAVADPANEKVQHELSVTCERLGDIAVQDGDLAAALKFFEQNHEIRKKLAAANPANIQAQIDLSISCNKLGHASVLSGHLSTSRELHQQALNICKENAAADPAKADVQIYISYNHLGYASVQSGELMAATIFYQQALEICKRIVAAEPANAVAQRDLSVTCGRLGDVSLQSGNKTTAAALYQQALEIDVKLAAADPTNAQAQRDLSVDYEKLGNVSLQQGDPSAARDFFQRCLDIQVKLAAADPAKTQVQRGFSITYYSLGEVNLQIGDLRAAREFYLKALDIRKKLAAAHPDNASAQSDLSLTYGRLGDVSAKSGDQTAAQNFYQQVLDIHTKLAAADPSNGRVERNLMIAFYKASLVQTDPAIRVRHLQTVVAMLDRMIARGHNVEKSLRERMNLKGELARLPAVAE